MFLKKTLGRFYQDLNSQQPFQVSTEPGEQLKLIPVAPSVQQCPQQMILPPSDELHFHPPNQSH